MPDTDVLDLEERLTRHYADVATAPSLHRRPSATPRLVFAGLLVALIAGAAYVSSLVSTREDIAAEPLPNDAVTSELMGLLERVPDTGALAVGFADFERARTLSDTGTLNDDAPFPAALDLTAPLPQFLVRAQLDPGALEQAFGFGLSDVLQSLVFQTEEVADGNIIRVDRDLDEVLDRAQADPDWTDRVSRRMAGSFDIVDWGDEGFDVARVSTVRELGRGGQLAGFDTDLLTRSEDNEELEGVLSTDSTQGVLADNEQFVDALALVHRSDSLAFMGHLESSGFVEGPDDSFTIPSVMIVDQSLDGSVRVVYGFAPDTDIDAAISNIVTTIEEPSEWVSGSIDGMSVTSRRAGEFFLIDLTPTDERAEQLDLRSIFFFMQDASKLR